MITRLIARRQARRLVGARPAVPQAWRRPYASDVDSVGRSLENSLQETHSIEALLQSATSRAVPQVNNRTHRQMPTETSKIAERYNILQHHNDTTGGYGAVVADHYKPHELLINPPSSAHITPELLLASQTHLGHSTSLWNPMNSRYIYGVRDGIHIIALEETAAHLRRACRVVQGVAERGGIILFAGTRPGHERPVTLAAKLAEGCHLFEKWIPGSITNGQQILGSCKLKMVDEHDQEIGVSEDILAQQTALKPDLVVCLNPIENWVLLHECGLNNIPTIGIIDTDADPTWVTYPIPANDDSLRCINVIAGVLGRAGQAGQARRKELAAQGKVLYEPAKLPKGDLGDRYYTKMKTGKADTVYKDEEGNVMSREQVEEMQRQGMFVNDSTLKIFNDNDGGYIRDEYPYEIEPATGNLVRRYRPVTQTLPGNHEAIISLKDVENEMAKEPERTGSPGPVAEQEALSSDGAEQQVASAQETMEEREEAELVDAANKIPEDGKQAKLNEEKKKRSH